MTRYIIEQVIKGPWETRKFTLLLGQNIRINDVNDYIMDHHLVKVVNVHKVHQVEDLDHG